MSKNEAVNIAKQIKTLELDLMIILGRLKVKEYRVKAQVLEARADLEEMKVRNMKMEQG
jgi:hypothetical protein